MKTFLTLSLHFLTVSILLITVHSCSNQQKTLKTINVDATIDKVLLSKVTQSVTPIVLETNDSCLITRITKVFHAKPYFIIWAFNGLFQFTNDGKFVRQIAQQGRGPQEYSYIHSVAVNSNQKMIYIATGKKIMKYNFEGEYIQHIAYPKYVDYMYMFDDNLNIISTKMGIQQGANKYLNRVMHYTLSSSLKDIDSMCVKNISLNNITGTINPRTYPVSLTEHNRYIYTPVLVKEKLIRDTLFQITPQGIVASLKVNFEGITPDNKIDKKFVIKNMFRSEQYLFVEYSKDRKDMMLCYNLKKDLKMNMATGFKDDFYTSQNVQLSPLSINSETFYYTRDGYDLIGKVEGVNEDSNPVIFIVKLK